MGSFGAMEMLVVAVFALIIFGPERLPEIARSIGRALSEFRRATSQFTDELKSGLEDEEPPRAEPPDWDLRPGPRG